MKIYTDADASLAPLEGQTVAILGYGNQGSAQARNLRDSGANVVIGNRDDSYAEQARADGFEILSIADAAKAADYAMVLTTDESQPLIWDEQIAPGVETGGSLVKEEATDPSATVRSHVAAKFSLCAR